MYEKKKKNMYFQNHVCSKLTESYNIVLEFLPNVYNYTIRIAYINENNI